MGVGASRAAFNAVKLVSNRALHLAWREVEKATLEKIDPRRQIQID